MTRDDQRLERFLCIAAACLPAALYVATADGHEVRGPYRADYQSLEVSPRYRSATVSRCHGCPM